MSIFLGIIAFIAAVWLIAALALDSKDHSEYDSPRHPSKGTRASESAEHEAAAKLTAAGYAQPPQVKGKEVADDAPADG